MNQTDIFGFVIDVLNKLKIQYMIVGSIASVVYGKPRLTYDIDGQKKRILLKFGNHLQKKEGNCYEIS